MESKPRHVPVEYRMYNPVRNPSDFLRVNAQADYFAFPGSIPSRNHLPLYRSHEVPYMSPDRHKAYLQSSFFGEEDAGNIPFIPFPGQHSETRFHCLLTSRDEEAKRSANRFVWDADLLRPRRNKDDLGGGFEGHRHAMLPDWFTNNCAQTELGPQRLDTERTLRNVQFLNDEEWNYGENLPSRALDYSDSDKMVEPGPNQKLRYRGSDTPNAALTEQIGFILNNLESLYLCLQRLTSVNWANLNSYEIPGEYTQEVTDVSCGKSTIDTYRYKENSMSYDSDRNLSSSHLAALAVTKPQVASENVQRLEQKAIAPKPNLSAYFLFCAKERYGVKLEHPDLSFGDTQLELERRWAATDEVTKEKFENLAAQDQDGYTRETAAYHSGAEFSSSEDEDNADDTAH